MRYENEALDTIEKCICRKEISDAIQHMKNFLYTFKQLPYLEHINALEEDYVRMCGYWRKGMDDPERDTFFRDIQLKLYRVAGKVRMHFACANNAFRGELMTHGTSMQQKWTAGQIRERLEKYVTDIAMTDLLPNGQQASRRQQLMKEHQQLMDVIFDYLWNTYGAVGRDAQDFQELLLAPTVNSDDQQLMTSALTLSLVESFDPVLLMLLMRVYSESSDENVRMRALVAWVVAMPSDEELLKLAPQVWEEVRKLTGNEQCCKELAEMQVQLLYCIKAQEDTKKVDNQIIPEMLKENNLKIDGGVIRQVEEDPMEDVLNPEQSEQRMEKLEQAIHEMNVMQQQGADLFYGGFSQMKRYPFFNENSNWFVPFSLDHPGISGLTAGERYMKLLKFSTENSPMCDSDKFSFVLGFIRSMNRIPAQLMEMMDSPQLISSVDSATSKMMLTTEFRRRTYLQNLYRFYQLFPYRSEFRNIFDGKKGQVPPYLFLAKSPFRGTEVEKRLGKVVTMYVRRKEYTEALMMLQNVSEGNKDAHYYSLLGHVQRMKGGTDKDNLTAAAKSYSRGLMMRPDDERLRRGIADTFLLLEDKQAVDYFEKLYNLHPDDELLTAKWGKALMMQKQYEQAAQVFFKLNFNYPENNDYRCRVADCLKEVHKYEQAWEYVEPLLQNHPDSEAIRVGGMTQWYRGKVEEAIRLLKWFLKEKTTTVSAKELMTKIESPLQHRKSEVEVAMMIDQLLSS
jgi:tetratricopeptide (TPR) repeat protein